MNGGVVKFFTRRDGQCEFCSLYFQYNNEVERECSLQSGLCSARVTCAEPKGRTHTNAGENEAHNLQGRQPSPTTHPPPSVTPNNRQDGKLPAFLACKRRTLEGEFPHRRHPACYMTRRSTRWLHLRPLDPRPSRRCNLSGCSFDRTGQRSEVKTRRFATSRRWRSRRRSLDSEAHPRNFHSSLALEIQFSMRNQNGSTAPFSDHAIRHGPRRRDNSNQGPGVAEFSPDRTK